MKANMKLFHVIKEIIKYLIALWLEQSEREILTHTKNVHIFYWIYNLIKHILNA